MPWMKPPAADIPIGNLILCECFDPLRMEGERGKTLGIKYSKLTAASQLNEMLVCLPGS